MADSLDAAEWFLKRTLIAGVVLLVLTLAGVWAVKKWYVPAPSGQPASSPGATSAGSRPAEVPQSSGITLVVHFPDGFHLTWAGLDYVPRMTVLDAMVAARAHRRPLVFASTGSGETAFLNSLEGLANETGGSGGGGGKAGSTRCWQFWINGRFATSGMGAAILKPGDRVTWVFEPYSDNPKPPVP